MVSFIGDMWKCAVYIRNRFINFGNEDVQIVQANVNNKFVYLVCFPIINCEDMGFLNLDSMKKQKNIYEGFSVKCDYFMFSDNSNVSFYGVYIQ